VARPEELLAELPELAAPSKEAEQRPTAILDAHQGQDRVDRRIGFFDAHW
jgi:hypothetical protein